MGVKPPDQYLGAKVKCHFIKSYDDLGRLCWTMSSGIYVKRDVDDVESHLNDIREQLSTKPTTMMSSRYRPEIDVSWELDVKRVTYFQGLIGVLRWACELGCIYIIVPVALLSSLLANPRE